MDLNYDVGGGRCCPVLLSGSKTFHVHVVTIVQDTNIESQVCSIIPYAEVTDG